MIDFSGKNIYLEFLIAASYKNLIITDDNIDMIFNMIDIEKKLKINKLNFENFFKIHGINK